MCDTAAHLVDHVFPDVRLRQWVLSVPFELRLLLATRPKALSVVGRIFCREVMRWQRGRAQALGYDKTRGGAVCFVQRFGGSLNLNVHYHVVVPDAVFCKNSNRGKSNDAGRANVVDLPAPRPRDLTEIATAVATRVVRWLRRHGYIDAEQTNDERTPTPLEKCLTASLGVGQLHADPDSTVKPKPRRELPKPKKGLVGECGKFNIHAGVSIGAGCPEARERLLRYCARAPLSLERLHILDDGRIAYNVRHHHGKQGQVRVMTPMQFMARLAALIPPPRHPLVRFHGVFAPNSKWRSAVVPEKRESGAAGNTSQGSLSAKAECHQPRGDPRDAEATPQATASVALTANDGTQSSDGIVTSPHVGTRQAVIPRLDWATLLKRVYDVDALQCPKCGDRMRFVEVVEERSLARSLLGAAGVLSEPQPLARARAPDWDDC
jgi:hypothetical protein